VQVNINYCNKYAKLPVFNDKVRNLKHTAMSVRTTNKQQTASDLELSAYFLILYPYLLEGLKETVITSVR